MNNTIITKISLLFAKRSRVTILFILATLVLGFYSYTSVLKREGFPVINIPVVVVATPYFSGDAVKTEKDITHPIYESLSKIEDIKEMQTTSTDKFSTIVVYLQDDITSTADVKAKIDTSIKDLQLKNPSVITVPNAAQLDGENDFVFALHSESLTVQQLQEKARIIETALLQSTIVKKVNIKDQFVKTFDVRQGKEVIVQNSFSRISLKESGKSFDSLNVGIVKKSSAIGAIEFSDGVREIINKELQSDTLAGISVDYTGDPADSLKDQISSLEMNAIAAIITIFVIILLFINWRSAIILALFIPITLGSVFLIFAFFGYTLNTISLFALVLVLGLFVDDGTIVVEAIDYYKRQGYKGFDAVAKAVNDIGVADISGTLSTVLVFIPLVSISGVLGDFIKILPITVIIALVVSLVIALTVLPFISSYLIKDQNKDEKDKTLIAKVLGYIPGIILQFGMYSSRWVNIVLSKRVYMVISIVITVILIGIGGLYAAKLPFSFFAAAKDSDLIATTITFKPGLTIGQAREKSIEIENLIRSNFNEEVEKIVYYAANERSETLRLELTSLTTRKLTANQLADTLNEKAKEIEGVVFTASIVSAGPPAVQYPFAMQLFSTDSSLLQSRTADIQQFIRSQTLANEVKIEDVKVNYITDIRTLDGSRYAEVSVKFSKNSDSATLLELQKLIEDEFDFRDSKVTFDFGQESDNASSFASVALAGIVAIFVMYGLLVLQFNSFTQPLLILLAIPFSFPGLFAGLYYTNNPLSFFVVVGLTGLVGIVVNNTIMLIEYANAKRDEGKDLLFSISEAVRLRTRPILTTSLVTVAGLVPLAISEPFWEPLAFTIIFGLLSSVIMIIVAFPVFYYIVERLREKFYSRFNKKSQ